MQVEGKWFMDKLKGINFDKIHHGVELRKKIDLSFYNIFVIGSKDYIEMKLKSWDIKMKVLRILDFAKL
jgi:hypothetical protein